MSGRRTALLQVLGAVAYGEWKAYEGARAKADDAADEGERRLWRKVAAEELRHHKGFVARIEALGGDPERAMRPYRRALDAYHAGEAASPVEQAVWSYLGEGVAEDLLVWLRRVVDGETARFIDGVLADEGEHEERATRELVELLDADPANRREATRAARRMAARMLASGTPSPVPFGAFLRLGRAPELVAAIVGGQWRRLRAIGVSPVPGLG